MTKPKTIKVFLAEGKPTGLRVVELLGWTGKGYIIPRDSLKEGLKRDDLGSQAVYFLVGENEEGLQVVYVGESENFAKRARSHQQKKEFWNTAICFIATDENLNKAHVKYLESVLAAAVENAGRAQLEKGQSSRKAGISESEEAYIQEFAENIKLSLSAVGFTFLKQPTEEEDVQEVFYCEGKGVKAKGALTSEGFVIFSGSTIVGIDKETDTIGPGMKQQRRQIIQEAKAQEVGEGWKLTEDVLTNSPSRAGGIVLGRRNNGWTTWKNEDGETLDEVKRQDV